MRLLLTLLACSLCSSGLRGQSQVDRLVTELDFLSKGSLDHWKYSTSFTADPTKPGFDDGQWQTLSLGQSVYPDSCWLRKEVSLPERMLGAPTAGPVRFLVSVDDYGFLWINGAPKGHFPWDGDFELTSAARPGEKFVLVIKAINTGGPLRLLRAQITGGKDDPLGRSIEDFSLGIRVAQKLLSFDTYQTNARMREDPGTDKSRMDRGEKSRLGALLQSAASAVNLDALRKGNVDAFRSSLEAARTSLAPVAAYAKRFTLYFDSNAHIDAAWLWREKETIRVCRNTFASVMNMMAQRPGFTFTQSSAAYYDWMERLYPELFRQIQQRAREGRWEVVGGMWVEPDCNLPSGESWARHLLYAKRYFRDKLSTDVKIGWNPDSFGYTLMMPAFYARSGIDAFITQKIGWNETNVFPHRLFWWESPDRSRILSYFPFDYVNTVDDPYRLVDWLRQFEANTGFTKMLVLFGVGDHGGGPSLAMLDRIDRLKTIDIFPAIGEGTAGSYLGWLRTHDLSGLPVWKDELYLEYHQGTFTTQAAMKASNRSNEVLLTDAEKASSIAALSGRRYGAAPLGEAWKKLLFNQFHDILPGSSIREVYLDAAATHRDVAAIGSHELHAALDHVGRQVNTAPFRRGTPLIVYNTLSWARTDLVTAALPGSDTAAYAVFDAGGKEVASQIESKSRYERQIMFVASRVPPLGYATYELRKQKPARRASAAMPALFAMENASFRITVDSASGWLSSIRDKRNGMEILRGNGNELQLLEDKPSAWDAWNIGLTGVQFPSTFRRAEVIERGPVRFVLRLHRDYLKPGTVKEFPTEDFPSSFFTQDIIVYNGLDRIDFVTGADWWEEKTMLKVAFPLAFTDTAATYEIPYGTIRRSTRMRTNVEKARVEVPAARWADVSASGYGVTLINSAKYGYDIKGHTMRLSLLRSPKWPDATADRGMHAISYALYPHTGDWVTAASYRRGYEFNTPLLARMADAHAGKLPATTSFVSIAPAHFVLTSVKQAEEGAAWVVQWYDVTGEGGDAVVRLPARPAKAVLTDFLEDDGAPVAITGSTVTVPTPPHGIITLKAYW